MYLRLFFRGPLPSDMRCTKPSCLVFPEAECANRPPSPILGLSSKPKGLSSMKPPFGIGLIKHAVQSTMALFEPPPTEFYRQMARDYRYLSLEEFDAKYGNDWAEVHKEQLIKALNYGV